MTDLNNKNLGKKGNKVKKISALNSYITNKIDGNQNIRRLIRYFTTTPLSSTGKDLNGNIVKQPDLLNSLKIDSSEGLQSLWRGEFDENTISQEQCFIFVHTFKAGFKGLDSKFGIAVDILVPQKRDVLRYDEESRSCSVGDIIENMFDDLYIENDEYVEYLGNVKFKLIDVSIVRLSKTNSLTRTTLTFNIDTKYIKGFR